ncbi:MAG: restriction endonuclease subunit S [Chitinophagaceae bacterium]|nr:restriction endonuclease subunit S [Chitinophagaceae bacterium]
MSEWVQYRFSDFVEINPKVRLVSGSEYPFIEMKDLDSETRYCHAKTTRVASSGARFESGDTLFAKITPCLENGKICQVGNVVTPGFGSTEFLVFRGKPTISDSDFIFYLSRSQSVREFAENNFEGTSGRQRVPKSCFELLYMILPQLAEQKVIADCLGGIDAKIDLLHRQNCTLQHLNTTIFKQMFGCSDSGTIRSTLRDEFDFTMGQSPPGDALNEEGEGIEFYQGNADFGFRFPQARVFTTVPTRLAKKYNTLISVRAPVGEINMALGDCCLGRGVAAFRYKSNPGYYSYAFYKLQSIVSHIKQFNDTGTVFGSISKTDFEKMEIDIPPKSLIDEFEAKAAPLDSKIYHNHCQIQTLSNLRDKLLPKLISGEIKLKHEPTS